jgi:ABC-type polysaccharide/polyol phosphate export permease
MSQYMAAIWKCRYFWLSLVQMDLRTRYRRSILGLGWSLLQPLAMTIVLCVVFAKLFGQDPIEYGPRILVGLCFWNFITASTLQGTTCLFSGEKYIRQYPAPMAIYPLRTMLGAAFHFLVAILVVVLMRFCFQGFGGLSSFLSLIPVFLMLLVLGWSLAVLAGFSTAHFPDVQHLAEVGLQILFYGTPIIYPAALLRDKELGWIIDFNPLAAFIEALRMPLLDGQAPSLELMGVIGLSTVLFASAATWVLVRLEPRVIFYL